MLTPKISIITAVYNGKQFLPTLINSIACQTYSNYEFIIIDAVSTDGTIEIIKANKSIITYWISEKDNGIYDAWNKGLKYSTGDWIMFLGCDDILLEDALENYVNYILRQTERMEYISSRIQIVDVNLKKLRIKGWKWEWPRFIFEMTVAHPGSLHARSLFEKYGRFDTSYKIVGDYELLLRPASELKWGFLDKITAIVREGGTSDSWSGIKEIYRAVTLTGKASKFISLLNMYYVGCKFFTKKAFRLVGFNVYLRKAS